MSIQVRIWMSPDSFALACLFLEIGGIMKQYMQFSKFYIRVATKYIGFTLFPTNKWTGLLFITQNIILFNTWMILLSNPVFHLCAIIGTSP